MGYPARPRGVRDAGALRVARATARGSGRPATPIIERVIREASRHGGSFDKRRRTARPILVAVVLAVSAAVLGSCSGSDGQRQVVVPNLIGLAPIPAIRALCSRGLVPGRLTALPRGAAWTGKPDDINGMMGVSRVVRQAPAAGTKVAGGTRVPYAFVAPSNWSFQMHVPAGCDLQRADAGG